MRAKAGIIKIGIIHKIFSLKNVPGIKAILWN